ncbi:energy transducer TonB [Pseudomonas sp.]|uniref:energy transducer TonB n=1 Tax=Pseudomonas sp. TaxID=306 RepID=UPI002731A081|nr:energy transducer TonB [Pseudomonas sp.]MDP2246357.1 energy transducer TonB [Pseudomonas sp.]
MLMERPASITWPRLPASCLRNAQAVLLTLVLHGVVLALLLANWPVEKPLAPSISTLSMQLVSLPPPAPVMEAPLPVPLEAPLADVRAPVEPQIDPRIAQQKLEQAALARKRVEHEKREQDRQRLERKREEQTRLDQQQREQEQRQQAERLQQVADQQRQQADAAARAHQAQAAAASRQYLPIAKQAPAYPQRALDKGLEGECTVSYTVNALGRVEDPQVAGECHPLFIRPSLTASKSFRYQPRVIDGKAVAVPNVKNTFTYRIE